MSNPAAAREPQRHETGVPGLDDVLHGGLIADRLYLLEGDPGTGKTTLALQFLLEGRRAGDRCLYITLSETREELTASAASHGWALDGLEIVEIMNAERDLDAEARVTMYHPAEIELSETMQRVFDAVERASPQRVVFDSLSEVRLLAQDSLRYRRQVMAMKSFFAGRNCTVLLLDDQTLGGREPQLESIAHGILALEQGAPQYGAERRRLRMTKYRGSTYRGGFHDFTIRTGGVAVFPRLVAAEHREEFKQEQIKSGIVALDKLLGGGPDRGTSTLIMGPAGAGKSTLAVQYAVAAAQRGDHSAIFAFDESVASLRARCRSLGIPLNDGLGNGTVMVQQIDPAEMSPGEFTARVRECVEKEHASVIVIDSLNGFMNAMPDERFLAMHLHELLTYLARCGVTTIMVSAQHGLLGASMTSVTDASYLADSVVLLRFFEHSGHVKKAISVVKKRTGPHEDTIRELRLGPGGIVLGPALEAFSGILAGVPVERALRRKRREADGIAGPVREPAHDS